MKYKSAIVSVVIFAFVAFPLLTGAAQTKPTGKLVIVYSNLGNETLDSVKTVSRNEEAILESLGDGLTIMQYHGANAYFKPAIASSWKISPDLMTYEFTIRKDIKFHD